MDNGTAGADTARLTEQEAQANVHAVLQLCASGKLRCSEKTRRPSTATITAVAEALSAGDFLAHDPIASFAWPLLIHAGGLAEQAGNRLQLTALKVLPNLDIVALDEIPVADRLVLDAYAEHSSEHVWSLTATALLAALDNGRSLEEFRRFLGSRAHTDLPSTVTTLIDDIAGRASRLRDLGMTQLVECADPALAALISNDRRLQALCHPVGDRHLAVAPEHGIAFRKGLRTLGYALN